MAIFVIALVVIGGLIYSPGQVETMIRGFWTSLTG
jgi:Flp pilus assembly pilin Flp